jgi:GT2 family glycosyltransferase
MLSIVVAVHNQIGHNRLFLEGIRRYTSAPYEVVVIDNHSTDGSTEFFESQGCRVIRNAANLCYPESMNLGTRQSRGEYLCHINNDLYVGPNWNGRLIEALNRFQLDAITPLGLEMMPTPALTDWLQSRWATIGQGRLSSGKTTAQLHAKIRAMYGDWEDFCAEVYRSFSDVMFDGLNGSCVLIRRSTLEKIGFLDERIQAADWDLYYTLRKREEELKDVRRCKIFGGSYVHHFIRATVKGRREPFACLHPRLSIHEKWTREEEEKLWYKPNYFQAASGPRSFRQILRRRVGKPLEKVVREVNRALSWRWLYVQPQTIVELHRRQFEALANTLVRTGELQS